MGLNGDILSNWSIVGDNVIMMPVCRRVIIGLGHVS